MAMMNKFTKKLSAIVCMGIVVYEQQLPKASPSYAKLLKRYHAALILCKDSLPSYDDKGVKQIQRLVIDYGNRVFDPEGHHSVLYTSLLLAMVDQVLYNEFNEGVTVITKQSRKEAFLALYRSLMQLQRYYDRKGNKIELYEQAKGMADKWRWLF
jgi:hypothetical protein